MPQLFAVLILLALTLVLLWLMRRGWRNRERAIRISELPALPPGPTPREQGTSGVYVATTLAGQPLERVVTRGLGVRSRVIVFVRDTGVILQRQGANSLFIPFSHLHEVGTTGGMIGKVAAPDSIIVFTWNVGDTLVDTGVHIRDTSARLTLLDHIAVNRSSSSGSTQ